MTDRARDNAAAEATQGGAAAPEQEARLRASPGRRALLALAAVAGLFAAAPTLVRRMRSLPPPDSDLSIHAGPRGLPTLRFADGEGKATSLAAFRGRVVLLNVWATWCAPCREEMPTLDRLQATLGGPGFEVVALSIDQGGLQALQAFFARTGIRHLHPYVDTSGDAMPDLGAAAIPLTLLIDRDGGEIARKLGPAAWDHPQMVRLIQGYLTHQQKGST